MPLVGGGVGGASNTLNPSGTGSSINYIGNHAYAYSGTVSSNGSSAADTTALKFTTGNSYVRGFLSFQTSEVGGGACYIDLKVNSEIVINILWDGDSHGNRTQPLDIILPPYSDIEVLTGTGNDRTMTVQITGSVYA